MLRRMTRLPTSKRRRSVSTTTKSANMGSLMVDPPSPQAAAFPVKAAYNGDLKSHASQRNAHTHAAAAQVSGISAHFDSSLSAPVRKYLQTYGLTPPRIESYETQKARCLGQLALKTTDIDRFLYLSTLRKNNVHLFYRLMIDHLRELTPMIYTPVVGEACQRWSEIYQQAEGMYLSFEDLGTWLQSSAIGHNTLWISLSSPMVRGF